MNDIVALIMAVTTSYTAISSESFSWFCVIAVPFSKSGYISIV